MIKKIIKLNASIIKPNPKTEHAEIGIKESDNLLDADNWDIMDEIFQIIKARRALLHEEAGPEGMIDDISHHLHDDDDETITLEMGDSQGIDHMIGRLQESINTYLINDREIAKREIVKIKLIKK